MTELHCALVSVVFLVGGFLIGIRRVPPKYRIGPEEVGYTAGRLRNILRDVHDDVWVVVPGGPVREVQKELGANEPYVILSPR